MHFNINFILQGMEDDDVNLCQPIILKITATEVVSKSEQAQLEDINQPDSSEVDIAIIIDDIINREPRFLRAQ